MVTCIVLDWRSGAIFGAIFVVDWCSGAIFVYNGPHIQNVLCYILHAQM